MSTAFRAAAAQVLSTFDVAANAHAILLRLDQAAEHSCQVVLFPEGCLTGYPDTAALGKIDFAQVADEEEAIRAHAEELQVAVMVGSTSRDADGIAYNDLLLVDDDGTVIGRYAKTWPKHHYGAGSGPVVFSIAGVTATCIICADLRYPELVRLPAALGAQIAFIANNESGLDREDKLLGYRSMQISRATENMIFAVMANAPADAGDFGRYNSSHGNSKIVAPLGAALAEAGSFAERLVIADLDLEQATGGPPRRTLADRLPASATGARSRDRADHSYPAYADWVAAGTRLVARLQGAGRDCRRARLGADAPTGARLGVDLAASGAGGDEHETVPVAPGAAV